MSDDRSEGVFARWSRRKQEGDDGGPEQTLAPETTTDAADRTDANLTEAEYLEKHRLPDPETLKQGDDFSAFLKSGVPDMLRRRALRALWASNPALANLDGLIDYGEDFTDSGTAAGTVATVYRVGRGILRDLTNEDDSAEDGDEPAPGIDPEENTAGRSAADSDESVPGGDPESRSSQDEKTDESELSTARAEPDKSGEVTIPETRIRRMRFEAPG